MGKQARKSLAQPSPSKDNRPRDTTPNGPFSPTELRFNIGKANGNLDCGEISEPISTHPIMPRNHRSPRMGLLPNLIDLILGAKSQRMLLVTLLAKRKQPRKYRPIQKKPR